MAVSKRLRYEVLRRDNHQCKYCGAGAPDVALTVDHVVPVALGGSDDASNLVAACKDCNAGKSASSPDSALVVDVDQRAAEWGRAMTVAMDQRMAEFSARNARVETFDRAWKAWSDMPREPAWRTSVSRFLAFGLTDEFLVAAIDTAMGNRTVRHGDVWKYFCGICWKEIRKAQDAVRPGAATQETALHAPATSENFDFMRVFEAFLGGLVPALGGSEEVCTFVERVLWDVMPEADKVWRESLSLPRPDDLDDDEEDCSATDAAREHVADCIAPAMYEIMQWRYDGGRPTLPETAPPRQRWDAIVGGYNSYLLTVGKIAALVGVDAPAAMRGTVAFSLDVEKKFAELCASRPYKGQDADRDLLLTAFQAAYPGDDEWIVLREVPVDGS